MAKKLEYNTDYLFNYDVKESVNSVIDEVDGLKSDVNGLIDLTGFNNSIVLLGDSITAQNNYIDATTNNTNNAGFFTVGNIKLGSFFNVVKNAGISGNNTSQMLARFDNDVLAHSPDWLFILAGANDLLQSVPISDIKSNLSAIYDKADSAGLKVIVATQYASSFFNQTSLGEMNRFIKNSARTRGYLLVDFEAATTNPLNTSYPYTFSGITFDSLHLNAYGAMLCADEVYSVLSKFVTKTPLIPSKTDPTNKTLNLLNTGSSGTLTGGVTGVCPTNWQVDSPSIPSGSSAVSSIVSGKNNNKVRIDMAGTTTFETYARHLTSSPVAGKSYYAIAEVKADLTDSVHVSLRMMLLGGGSTTLTAHANRKYADNAVVSSMLVDGVIITPVLTNVNSTSAFIDVYASGKSGYIEIGRVGFIQID